MLKYLNNSMYSVWFNLNKSSSKERVPFED